MSDTGQDVAIKAPHALVMLPREIKDRRVSYTFFNLHRLMPRTVVVYRDCLLEDRHTPSTSSLPGTGAIDEHQQPMYGLALHGEGHSPVWM